MPASKQQIQRQPPRFFREHTSAPRGFDACPSPTTALQAPSNCQTQEAGPTFCPDIGEYLSFDFCAEEARPDKQNVDLEAAHRGTLITRKAASRVSTSRIFAGASQDAAGELAQSGVAATPSPFIRAAHPGKFPSSGTDVSNKKPAVEHEARAAGADSIAFGKIQSLPLPGQNPIPTAWGILLSCGAVVLTWLQDPLLTLLASSITALTTLSVVRVNDSEAPSQSQVGDGGDRGTRNVAVAAVGASGQLCDGVAALTIGLGITTAVLCSAAAKKETSCPSSLLSGEEDKSERIPGEKEETARVLSSSSCSANCSRMSAGVGLSKEDNVEKGHHQYRDGVLFGDAERGIALSEEVCLTKQGHGRDLHSQRVGVFAKNGKEEEPEAGKLHETMKLKQGKTLDPFLALRTCFVGVWISAYAGILLSFLLRWSTPSLLRFFFSPSSSPPMLFFLSTACISLRLFALPFSVVALTAKAALLSLHDHLPPVLSGCATLLAIPLLLFASRKEAPVTESVRDASTRPSAYEEQGPFFADMEISGGWSPRAGGERQTYYRLQSILTIVVVTQITVAVILVLRLIYRGLILVRRETVHRDTSGLRTVLGGHVEGGTEIDGDGRDVFRTEGAIGRGDTHTPPSTLTEIEKKRKILLRLLRPPKAEELRAFCPFLASFFVQSAVRVVLYSSMMKVAASGGVNALAAHQVASSVYTVHALPCEALTQVTQSVIHRAEAVLSATTETAKQALPATPPSSQKATCAKTSAPRGKRVQPQIMRLDPEAKKRHSEFLGQVHRRLLYTAAWMGLAAAASVALIGTAFAFSLKTSSRGLSATLFFSCLASTPALVLLPVTAAFEGLLLHGEQLRAIVLAYLGSLPLPLGILLYSRFQNSHRTFPGRYLAPEEKANWTDAKTGGISHCTGAGAQEGDDTPSYVAATVWLLPLVYNLGRASVFGRAWCRGRYIEGEKTTGKQ
ncbi:transmembrane protein [Cystoisospora suis]|uniref:Transmembrane protein n=1 Tax=Cystoisospora suis TaxID=483139 RepID=A0A2C6L4F8_9APIC|nr:transmembrane protein [Cystoisospora suis]